MIAFVLAVTSGAALAETQTVGSDGFNDGIRNTAIWKKTPSVGAFIETSKRLYFTDQGVNRSTSASSKWSWKSTYQALPGDVVEMSAVIRFPDVPVDPTGSYGIGLGFGNRFPDPTKIFEVTVFNDGLGAQVYVLYGRTARGYQERFFVLPASISKFRLILRYDTSTGFLTLLQETVDRSWSGEMGTINLNTAWNKPIGSTMTLAPYVLAWKSKTSITPATGMYLDKFLVTITNP